MFAYQSIRLAGICLLLGCEVGAALSLNDIYDEGHLYYTGAGFPAAFSRLSEPQNELLQDLCGFLETEKEIPQLRLSGAIDALSGQFPWAVAFVRNNDSYCGGVLISDRHVLTAAHCFYNSTKMPCKRMRFMSKVVESTTVNYGGVCLRKAYDCPEEDVQSTKIGKIILPIAYTEKNCVGGQDYAIVELAEKVEFSMKTRPICLRRFNPEHLYYEAGLFTEYTNLGWGYEKEDKRQPKASRLRFFSGTQFKGVEDKYLMRAYHPHGSPCKGDSGSPMLALEISTKKRVLLGIMSAGRGCDDGPTSEFYATFLPSIIPEICYFTGVCPPKIQV